ncbi:hypothetical protein AX14_000804 [Amanita brunnescens Koide BX004]|nr:hypothetical protein AX14_000804 [Amanita brunnescens Koide BX004]
MDCPFQFRKKDGTPSKMRSHKGNIPVLPQTKLCPHCPAKFTRTTHLNRHLRTHTNERLHHCDTCSAKFTRSDLLTRHKKSCNESTSRTRRKSLGSLLIVQAESIEEVRKVIEGDVFSQSGVWDKEQLLIARRCQQVQASPTMPLVVWASSCP